MKIHNLGSDYAYQQRLRNAEHKHPDQRMVEPQTQPTDNVENQLQAGGETTMATVDNETFSGEKENRGETKKASRKKKKEKTENNQQLPPECQI